MNRLHSLLVQHHILRLQVSVNDLVGIQMRPNMWKCLTNLSDLDDSHTSAWVPYMPRSWFKTNVRRLCGLDTKPDVRASEKVNNFWGIIQSKTILCNCRHWRSIQQVGQNRWGVHCHIDDLNFLWLAHLPLWKDWKAQMQSCPSSMCQDVWHYLEGIRSRGVEKVRCAFEDRPITNRIFLHPFTGWPNWRQRGPTKSHCDPTGLRQQ